MNKKIFAAFLLLVFLLAGCTPAKNSTAKWKPEIASDDVRPYAEQALKIIDKYLDFQATEEETESELDQLSKRIRSLGISSTGSEYNNADKAIDRSVAMLGIGYCTDAEYRLYRDIISFQLGKETSGRTHRAERIAITNEERLKKFVNFSTTPFDSGSIYEDSKTNMLSLILRFDKKDGVEVSHLAIYMEDVLKNIAAQNIDNASVLMSYDCFLQPIFYISIEKTGAEIRGSVYRTDEERNIAYQQLKSKYTTEEIAKMETYPEEFSILNPLYEFDSIYHITDAAAIASKFAGVE